MAGRSVKLTVLALLVALTAIAPATQQTQPLETVPASHERMVDMLRRVAEASASYPWVGDGSARQLRSELAVLPESASSEARWKLTIDLAEAELRLGNELEAIRLFTEARDLIPESAPDPGYLNHSQYRLGVAHLRRAETLNCAHHANPDACILPLRRAGIHRDQNPARQAILAFTKVIEFTPEPTVQSVLDDTAWLNLSARWLLNIAYMTVGGYPDEVPEAYLLPPAVFQSVHQIPRFDNVAPALGLDTFDLSGGAVADDFDNDGYLDILVSTYDVQGRLHFFRNNQDGTFSDRTQEAGLIELLGGLNIVQADYDNDGNVDVFVLRGAWFGQHGRHPNSLIRNNGDGTFADVTFAAGLGEAHYPTQTASWADYDNDGALDLYVGNETSPELVASSQLFRNNGDGTFTDVAEAAAVMNHRYAKAAIWGDYDADGFPDLYVSNMGGANRLYRNTGRGFFIDVAPDLDVANPRDSFPAWFWDVDNDGALDLFVSAYAADIQHLAARALGFPGATELARLYRGTGDGHFEDVADRYELVEPSAPMGSNFGDLDNDGYLDFFLGTGYPPYESIMPSLMYRNQGGQRFVDVTYSGGFGHLQKGHSVFFADLDNDGDQDVFEQMGGAYPGDGFSNALFENPGFGNNWIAVKLVGVRSNRSAIGARIRIDVIEDEAPRSIFRYVNSGGTFGANPLRQTIGLGGAARIERLEVFWPTTGVTQSFTDLGVNQTIRVVEDEDSYMTVDLKTLTFRSTSAP